MKHIQKKQQGGSVIIVIIILAIIGTLTYIGLQYFPQYLDVKTVETILNDLEQTHKETPFKKEKAVSMAIEKYLDINDKSRLKDNFKITRSGSAYIVSANYQRELNLIFTKKPMPYEKTITLE